MVFLRKPQVALLLGLLVCIALAYTIGGASGARIVERISAPAPAAIAQAGGGDTVKAQFRSPNGWPSRHPVLTGAEALDETTRARIARAVAALPGVGGIRWADGDLMVEQYFSPLHCQEDVQALLQARTIRFEEGSDTIDEASISLVDEVATALRPCPGAEIQISGHTDRSGSEDVNIALSTRRAQAVRQALIRRGIPGEALQVTGEGSARPVEGLEPTDPANRRIEFAVLSTQPLVPTPVDTPGPR